MPGPFRTIGLIGKYGDPGVRDTVLALARFLRDLGREVLLDSQTARRIGAAPQGPAWVVADREELGRRADLVVAVGGDGTLLNAARSLATHEVPLLGVNLGRLGFLADVSPAEMGRCLEEIVAGRAVEEERLMLRARVLRRGRVLHEGLALNDAVLHKWNTPRMIEYETYVDGRFVDVQRSDGIIVSTPTGSTAYALSGGGPILVPDLDALALVPICPHTLSNRPIVLGGRARVELVVRDCNRGGAQLTCDGQEAQALEEGDRVEVRAHDRRIRLLHPPDHDHFQILRVKLGWGSKRS